MIGRARERATARPVGVRPPYMTGAGLGIKRGGARFLRRKPKRRKKNRDVVLAATVDGDRRFRPCLGYRARKPTKTRQTKTPTQRAAAPGPAPPGPWLRVAR